MPLGVCLLLLAASACNKNESVRTTLPRNGETNVDPRTIIALRVSDTFSDLDADNSDASLWTVTGDLSSAPYAGTISFARWKTDIFAGQTVDEFEGSSSPTEVSGEGEAVVSRSVNDTLVFELSDDVSFKDGETITVVVDHDITAKGLAIEHSKKFSFRVRSSGGAAGSLFVESTDPAGGALRVAARPRVAVRFNEGVDASFVPTAVTLRGSQSGVHAATEVAVIESADPTGAREVTVRLAGDDAFLPGETVTTALGAGIRGAAGDAAGVALDPHVFSFQTAGGVVRDGWSTLELPGTLGGTVRVLATDLDLGEPGVEFVVVTERTLEVYRQVDAREWGRAQVVLSAAVTDDGAQRVVDALLYDLDGDALQEVVLLLAGADESRLQIFEASDEGSLRPAGDPVAIDRPGAAALITVDLDGDGKLELFVTFAGGETAPALFRLQDVPPDPDALDVTDPDTLLPTLTFAEEFDDAPALVAARRLTAADLDGNGKVDLIAETATALVLYENVGTARTPIALREVHKLVPAGGGFAPRFVVVADIDADTFPDLLLAEAGRTTLYRDDGAGSLLDPDATPVEEALDLGLVAPVAGVALDVDGAGGVDIVAQQADGALVALLATDEALVYETLTVLPPSAPAAAFAVADVDADTGLDVAGVSGGVVRLALAEGVDAPLVSTSSTFRISSARTRREGDLLIVAIAGDIGELFAGYSLALDYDEEVLSFEGFDSPADLQSLADFTVCPDETGTGCEGNVAVTARYRQSTQGLPVDHAPLGECRFRLPEVTEATTTTVSLATFIDGGESFANTVLSVDGEATVSTAVAVVDGEYTVTLEPPAPSGLDVTCEVVSRDGRLLEGLVSWSSPAGIAHARFEVRVGGQAVGTVAGSATESSFTTEGVGEVVVSVRGLDAAGAELSRSECAVVGVHEPAVTCEALSATENRLAWTIHAVDRLRVYRNGVLLTTLGGAVREFVDSDSNASGSDLYEVSAVLDEVEGPRGACGPVGDPNAATTLSPRVVSADLEPRSDDADPNRLRLRWVNQEGYERIRVAVERVDEGREVVARELGGTATEFTFEGTVGAGGVAPGQYRFSLIGTAAGVDSEVATSAVVDVAVPTPTGNFLCSTGFGGEVTVLWDRVWAGYTDLRLRVEHRVDGMPSGAPREIPLALTETSRALADLAPVGVYTIRLVADYSLPLPPTLEPSAAALSRSCELSFDPLLSVPQSVSGGAGVERLEIPVSLDAAGEVQGFRFTLDVPAFLALDPETALELPAALAGAETVLELLPGASADRRRAAVTVTGISSVPDVLDGARRVATLVVSVPLDFTLPDRAALDFVGDATLRFPTLGETGVETRGGELQVHRRFVELDRATVAAGSTDEVRLTVRGTFDEPAPGYRLIGYTIHLGWNPADLELLPLRMADQEETVVAGRGTMILPDGAALQAAQESGDIAVPWLGIDFRNPSELVTLSPGADLPLLVVRFRSRLPAASPSRFLPVDFLLGPGVRNATSFIPERDILGEDDLQGVIGGGVQVLGSDPTLRLSTVSPREGSFLGGDAATLTGSGFPSTADGLMLDFLLATGGSAPVTLPVDDFLEVSPSRIRFRVPDSGLRSAGESARAADVRMTYQGDRATLFAAYHYQPPALLEVSPAEGRAAGGEVVLLRGRGLPSSSTVRFRFADGITFPVTVLEVSPDGTELEILTPNLSGLAGSRASIDLVVPGITTLRLEQAFTLSGSTGGGPGLAVTAVVPAEGPICGGESVTVLGAGLSSAVQVFFGGVESSGPTVVGPGELRVRTPPVAEGTGAVDVVVTSGVSASASLAGGYRYVHPAGPFRRGDVNQSGGITILDAVLLSDLLFGRSEAFPENLDAADANDDGVLDGNDVNLILSLASGETPVLPEPFVAPGLDPTPDAITSCPEE